MCHELRVRLPCAASSVRAARSSISTELDAWGATQTDAAYDRVTDVVLVVSELVANAVRFCARDLDLLLVAHRDHIEIAVTDDNPQPAELQQPDPLTPSGRGLLLVDALAERWGQRQHGQGKTVWARLSVPPGSALGRNCTLPAD